MELRKATTIVEAVRIGLEIAENMSNEIEK
jgi:hypothetical protein